MVAALFSCYMAGANQNCCRLGASSVHTPYNLAPVYNVTILIHIRSVHMCLEVTFVTCHLHFWQNDRDVLRAVAVTRGWNGWMPK